MRAKLLFLPEFYTGSFEVAYISVVNLQYFGTFRSGLNTGVACVQIRGSPLQFSKAWAKVDKINRLAIIITHTIL